jgi:hypothetical protein
LHRNFRVVSGRSLDLVKKPFQPGKLNTIAAGSRAM